MDKEKRESKPLKQQFYIIKITKEDDNK